MQKFDMLIRRGNVIDTRLNIDRVLDIGIQNGKIAFIGDIAAAGEYTSLHTIDASGCYVTPGLIDSHIHVFWGGSAIAMPPEIATFCNGITTVIDAGTSGDANFEMFYREQISKSMVNIRSMLYVSACGQPALHYAENVDPAFFNREHILSLCEKYRDNIVALKLKQSKFYVGDLGLKPLKGTVELAEEAKVAVCVHVKDSPGEVRETLDILRPNDIFCHAFHQSGKTILDENGKVLPEVWEARQKGVLFDMAQGTFNLSFDVTRRALDQGFLPDIMSSDMSFVSVFRPPSYSFIRILSEFLNFGMSFKDIIKRCTEVPSKVLKTNEEGFMKTGENADLAILRIMDRKTVFTDCYGETLEGNQLIKPEATIKNGLLVFRQYDFDR